MGAKFESGIRPAGLAENRLVADLLVQAERIVESALSIT